MNRPLVSVVMATFNRCHLLERSLQCYAKQDFPKDQFELVIIDDHSEDDTQGLVYDFCHDHDIRYTILTTGPKKELWRDCGAVLNAGIRASTGEHIILTHPEVMPGRKSVAACVEALERFDDGKYLYDHVLAKDGPDLSKFQKYKGAGMYACCKPYYLSQRDQERIDTVDWLNDGPLAVRKIEGFYEDQPGHPDYKPRAIESVGTGGPHMHWLSWVFGGCSRWTWREIGGMLETNQWGSVDVAWVQRRKTLGIVNHTCTADDTLVVHCNHDDPKTNTLTPRVQEAWVKELTDVPLTDREAMTEDRLGWRS